MTTMEMKNGNQYKIQKSQNGGGNNADKNFTSWVEQDTFQTQHPIWNCS